MLTVVVFVIIIDYRKRHGHDYYRFAVNGVLFIGLNSQYYQEPSQVPDYSAEQDHFVDQVLEREARSNGYKRIVIFQHIPWFNTNHTEPKDRYYNIDQPEVRAEKLKRLADSGVKAIFSGHLHRNAGGWYKDENGQPIFEQVVSSAIGKQLGQDKSGIRIVRVFSNSIVHDYYPLEEVPKEVVLSAAAGLQTSITLVLGISILTLLYLCPRQ